MKKALIWIIIIALLVAGYFARQQYGTMNSDSMTDGEAMTGEILDEEVMTGEVIQDTLTGDTIQPTDGGETGVDPEFVEQMEAQAEAQATVESEELTDEDIKLIEDILQQITDSVQE